MKKLFYLIQIILLCCIAGCGKEEPEKSIIIGEKSGLGRYIWENKSDHSIKMSVFKQFENEILLPGEKIVKQLDNIGTIIHFGFYTRSGMSIVFDDGPYGGVFNASSVSNDPQPSPRDQQNCEYEEIEETDPGIYYSRLGIWTYTFTNTDYDAAVARGPMTDQ